MTTPAPVPVRPASPSLADWHSLDHPDRLDVLYSEIRKINRKVTGLGALTILGSAIGSALVQIGARVLFH